MSCDATVLVGRSMLRLRNPGSIDQAIQTIRTLENYLGNSTSLHDGEARKDAFLSWCEDQARPNLESLFDPTEGLLGEVESVYHRLALAPPMSLRRLNGMLTGSMPSGTSGSGRWKKNCTRRRSWRAVPVIR